MELGDFRISDALAARLREAELSPLVVRAKTLPFPHECEQERLPIQVPWLHAGIGAEPMWCTVDLYDDEIVNFHFDGDYDATLARLGYPNEDWVDQLVEGLVRVEFCRRHPR